MQRLTNQVDYSSTKLRQASINLRLWPKVSKSESHDVGPQNLDRCVCSGFSVIPTQNGSSDNPPIITVTKTLPTSKIPKSRFAPTRFSSQVQAKTFGICFRFQKWKPGKACWDFRISDLAASSFVWQVPQGTLETLRRVGTGGKRLRNTAKMCTSYLSSILSSQSLDFFRCPLCPSGERWGLRSHHIQVRTSKAVLSLRRISNWRGRAESWRMSRNVAVRGARMGGIILLSGFAGLKFALAEMMFWETWDATLIRAHSKTKNGRASSSYRGNASIA